MICTMVIIIVILSQEMVQGMTPHRRGRDLDAKRIRRAVEVECSSWTQSRTIPVQLTELCAVHCSLDALLVQVVNNSSSLTSLKLVSSIGHVSLQHLTQALPQLRHLVFNNSRVLIDTADDTKCAVSLESLEVVKAHELKELAPRAFRCVPELVSLIITHSGLTNLHNDTFKDVSRLRKLVLSDNHIASLPPGLFHSLRNLLNVNLDRNNLTTIHKHQFSNMNKQNLIRGKNDKRAVISLNENNIHEIDQKAFEDTWLSTLGLAHNQLHDLKGVVVGDPASPLSEVDSVLEIDLSFNRLSHISVDWLGGMDLEQLSELNKLNLSHNTIGYILPPREWLFTQQNLVVDLRYNNVTHIRWNISKSREELMRDTSYNLLLEHNPIACDTDMLEFTRSIRNYTSGIGIQLDDANLVTCESPATLRGARIRDVPLEACADCDCVYDPVRGIFNMVCAAVPLVQTTCRIRLVLTQPKVSLLNLPSQVEYLVLRNLNFTDVPQLPMRHSLVVLDLRDNSLSTVPLDLLLGNLTLYLAGNPISCACENSHLIDILKSNETNVKDYKELMCSGDERLILNVDTVSLCASTWIIYLPVFILSLGIVLLLIWKKERSIKEILYKNGIYVKRVLKEEYERVELDAFITFCEDDGGYVIDEIVKRLEPRFRLCVQERDWTPGEQIIREIDRCLLNSKRVILVLSKNYLLSRWGPAILTRALETPEKLIFVVKEEDALERLSPELLEQLKGSVIIRSCDTRFKRRLLYVMPHSRYHYHKYLKNKS